MNEVFGLNAEAWNRWCEYKRKFKEAFRGEWFRYSGPLPYFVNQILKTGDPDCIESVFAKSFNLLKSQPRKKPNVAAPVEELSSIDLESLAHLRAIRAEGNA
jgi:hypothetical protein